MANPMNETAMAIAAMTSGATLKAMAAFSFAATIPADTAEGSHRVVATIVAAGGTVVKTADISVVRSSTGGELARTGTDAGGLLAPVLLILGGLLVLVTRTRMRPE